MDLDAMEYLAAVWFVGGSESDWLAWLYRAKADHLWHFDYRFRYYYGTKDPFDGNDQKNFWRSTDTAGRTEQEQREDIELIAAVIAKRNERPLDRVDVNGPPLLLLEKAKGRSWFHVQRVPIS